MRAQRRFSIEEDRADPAGQAGHGGHRRLGLDEFLTHYALFL